GAADDEARLEHVGGTRAARARAGLVNVAGTGRSPAHRARVAGRVLAGVARPVARVGRAGVAVVGAGRAVGLLGVGGARRAAAGAEVVQVAFPHRGAAEGGRGLERIGRARRARAGAGLRNVADARGAPTGTASVARVVDAQRRGDAAITLIGRARVPIVGARGPRALDRVGGTSGAVPRTVFREVALVHRRATRERGRLKRVVGARAAAPRAGLRRVAPACRRPAGGPGLAGVVDAQRRGDAAIALIGRADLAIVGAGRTARLDDVGGPRAARAR